MDLETAAAPRMFNSSLAKGLQVLAAFDLGYQSLGLSQIVALTRLEKTAVQRFVTTFVATGYLRKDPVTRRYYPAPRLLRLGASFLRGNPLIERATPYMLNCNKEIGETVNLAVLDGAQIVLVARVPGREFVTANVGLGSAYPWNVSALGQAIVAHLPADAREKLVSEISFVQFASNTIMSRKKMRTRMEDVRRDGVVVVADETYDGDIAVAAPVFGLSGAVVAAVNIVVTAPRWSATDAQKLRPVVLSLANAISPREIGRMT